MVHLNLQQRNSCLGHIQSMQSTLNASYIWYIKYYFIWLSLHMINVYCVKDIKLYSYVWIDQWHGWDQFNIRNLSSTFWIRNLFHTPHAACQKLARPKITTGAVCLFENLRNTQNLLLNTFGDFCGVPGGIVSAGQFYK